MEVSEEVEGEGLLSGLSAEAPAPSQSPAVNSRPFEEEPPISGEAKVGARPSGPDPRFSSPDSQLLVTISGLATSTPYLEASSEDSALPSDTSLSVIGVEFSVPADCCVPFAGAAVQEVNGDAWENGDQTCTQVPDDGPPPASVETACVQPPECPERTVPAERSAPEPVTDQSAQSPGPDQLPNDVGIDEESLTSCAEADTAGEDVAPAVAEIGQVATQTRDDKPLQNTANAESKSTQPDIEASRVSEADKEPSPADQLHDLGPVEITSPVEQAAATNHSAPEPITDQSARQSPGNYPPPSDAGSGDESLRSCAEDDAAGEDVASAVPEIGQGAAQTPDDNPSQNIANTEGEPAQPDIEASIVCEGDEEPSPADQFHDLGPVKITSPVERAAATNLVMQSVSTDAEESPSRYRPPPQRLPRQAARPVTSSSGRPTSDLALGIRIRLRFDRFAFCEIRLLPERMAEMDNEVEVKTGGTSFHLVAQEEWYEDLPFDNIGDRLRQGLELKGLLADHRRVRWLLTGRHIYVLASHQRASGFVSTTRLVLGRSHVVLCAAELLQQVEGALNEAGCQGYTKLDEAHGVPAGWAGLRGVVPSRAVPLDPGIDPFYAIKPAPDIEIELEGGVCLRNSIWLAGFAPRIKLLGDTSAPVKALIDGKEAIARGDGSLAVDGYDQPGQHFVYCEGLSCSRSYSIEEPPDAWDEWPAYRFGQAEICGPLVHLLPAAAGRRIFSVPMSNPLLLGAEPGQIFRCSPRSVRSWKGFVPFDVVWALPAQPYICDKKTARIIQFSQIPLVLPSSKKHVLGWCAAILEASAKGLQIENASSDGMLLWKEYKKAARNLRRAAR